MTCLFSGLKEYQGLETSEDFSYNTGTVGLQKSARLKNSKQGAQMSVSYTHLDVYKRQV